MCLEYYGYDPCHYLSNLRLGWDAIIKMIDAKPDPTSDIDKYQFIEKCMRGGVSYITARYFKANKIG